MARVAGQAASRKGIDSAPFGGCSGRLHPAQSLLRSASGSRRRPSQAFKPTLESGSSRRGRCVSARNSPGRWCSRICGQGRRPSHEAAEPYCAGSGSKGRVPLGADRLARWSATCTAPRARPCESLFLRIDRSLDWPAPFARVGGPRSTELQALTPTSFLSSVAEPPHRAQPRRASPHLVARTDLPAPAGRPAPYREKKNGAVPLGTAPL